MGIKIFDGIGYEIVQYDTEPFLIREKGTVAFYFYNPFDLILLVKILQVIKYFGDQRFELYRFGLHFNPGVSRKVYNITDETIEL